MPTATLHAAQPLGTPCAIPQSAPSAAHEAARYAVLRRIGSAIRHQIAGALQPVSMLASLLERRMQSETPNLDALRKNTTEISGLSRSASSECVALMGWIAPHEGEVVTVSEGVEDCLHLLTTELAFRGFSVVNASAGQDALVGRLVLRTMLPASLLALTDGAAQAAQVHVSAHASQDKVTVSLALVSAERGEPSGHIKGYRPLTWQDVEALASDEGVAVLSTPQGTDLVFDRQQPAAGSSAAGVRWG